MGLLYHLLQYGGPKPWKENNQSLVDRLAPNSTIVARSRAITRLHFMF